MYATRLPYDGYGSGEQAGRRLARCWSHCESGRRGGLRSEKELRKRARRAREAKRKLRPEEDWVRSARVGGEEWVVSKGWLGRRKAGRAGSEKESRRREEVTRQATVHLGQYTRTTLWIQSIFSWSKRMCRQQSRPTCIYAGSATGSFLASAAVRRARDGVKGDQVPRQEGRNGS